MVTSSLLSTNLNTQQQPQQNQPLLPNPMIRNTTTNAYKPQPQSNQNSFNRQNYE